MNINIKEVTGFYDRNHKKIKTGDCLVFQNGSKYVVLDDEFGIILKSLSNNNMPYLLLSKITYGSILSTASISS